MTWDHRETAFVFGFVGGLAVNVARWITLSEIPQEERPDLDAMYWSQFVGLALFGGALALAHDLTQAITPLVAINLGLSVPALCKTALSELQRTKSRRRTN